MYYKCPKCKQYSSFKILDVYGYQHGDNMVESSTRRRCDTCGKASKFLESFSLIEIKALSNGQEDDQEQEIVIDSEWR